ncbi:MAG TPA: aminoglycoside phosphotransferase family protein [Gaiellaceae bacterium]|nr:aminoglycoside phosphotransferase family protein [Gaiellaceae bacterium]
MIEIPERLQWIADFPGGTEWLERLPRLVEESVEQWSLAAEEPFEYANVSLALPAGDVVLKISFPHRESEHEPAALAHWDGNGAVRLLAYDAERNAMLLERCVPGTSLLELPEREAYRHAAAVVRKLGERPAPAGHPFTPITETAARWARELPERWEQAGGPFERELLDAAVSALRELPPTQGELVVCHQDFHRGNVLAAEREPWLAIDPKPVVAEREFDTAALMRDGPGDLRWRLDFLASELELDPERMRGWAIAHTVAWGFSEAERRVYESQIDVARQLLRL